MKVQLNSTRRGYYQNDKIKCCKQCLRSKQTNESSSSSQKNSRKKQNNNKKKQRKKSCTRLKKPNRKDDGVSNFVIYSIVNTDFFDHRGNLAAEVAKGFLALYIKAERDKNKARGLDNWEDSGERLLVLNGINHKHLRYLAEEVYFIATEYHCSYRDWGKSRIMLVLTVLGRQEDLVDILETLTCLR